MMIYKLANVKKEEPQIIRLQESIKMIGVSARVNFKTIYRDSQTLGQRYQQVKQKRLIQNKRKPWAFTAVSKSFGEDGSWEYLMGDVVTSFDSIPDGLTGFEIPHRTYAKFSLQPRFVFLWGLAMGLLKKYIYTEWLPASNYVADSEVIGDFEYHDERSVSKKPEIDLYVAVKPKEEAG
jgi:predicted transcriptional regulator YdeE